MQGQVKDSQAHAHGQASPLRKPGITGRLDESRRSIDFLRVREDELMTFGRASSCLQLPHSSVSIASTRRPIGKQASNEAIGRQLPYSDLPEATQPKPPSATPTTTHPLQPLLDMRELMELKAHTLHVYSLSPNCFFITAGFQTRGTEIFGGWRSEQNGVENAAAPDDTDWDPRENTTDVEEAKSESDDPSDYRVDFEVFDSNDFMEGLRRDRLFKQPIQTM
ncbi:uncharacterized protein PITG_15804 [Phytophthora infestans T30-4]|uniref:Uncharacterized protein n=1 Tax=Phytophthora infestans (strain T30-4) TaxID=403677 RepID=D0NS62_PHYIT|nr:uncharacterized protein PITG_15804 [Phytophthora infestans T30-4]EEY63466.1 conserved hypothetical protein [Phytophthora infestans T30-4]|eukprot:XP_002898053.1 conserved hypothetical protein [Phytophthora infestans T30-4]